MKFKGGALFLMLAVFMAGWWIGPASADDIAFSNMNVGTVSPGRGHIGMDIWWIDASGERYNPCHHSSDAYYGACVMSNVAEISYYKVFGYDNGTDDYPFGMFIDNINENYCTTSPWCHFSGFGTIEHGWGRLVTGASIEIYPYDATGAYNPAQSKVGGVRIEVNNFTLLANSGRYSPAIGNVRLPQEGDEGIAALNGFVKRNGVPVGTGEATMDLFQNGSTLTTSTGVPVSGFSSVPVNADGYYNLGIVPGGSYHLYVTDNVTGEKIEFLQVSISAPYERLDFDLASPCFGQAGCHPL